MTPDPTTRDPAALLPCPFCGGSSVSTFAGSTFRWIYAECAECCARGPEVRAAAGNAGAYAEWNRRDAAPALLAEVERLTRDNETMRAADYHQVGVEQECELMEAVGLLEEIRGDYRAALGVSRENYDTFCRMGAMGRMPNDTWPRHFDARIAAITTFLAHHGARTGDSNAD